MRDSRRLQERGDVRLDRVQVIWLTLGAVVALGLVFALGFVVGRRAATFAPPTPAGDPIAQVDAAGDLHEQLSDFSSTYDKLTEPAPAKRRPPTMPARPPKPPVATPAPAPAPPVSAPAPEPPVSAPAVTSDVIRDALAAGPARPGDYTIQVSAYQSMAEARAYASSLERKGFRPFIVTGQVRGRGTWYRVRLGRFASESQANEGKVLLARADIPAWVLRTE